MRSKRGRKLGSLHQWNLYGLALYGDGWYANSDATSAWVSRPL